MTRVGKGSINHNVDGGYDTARTLGGGDDIAVRQQHRAGARANMTLSELDIAVVLGLLTHWHQIDMPDAVSVEQAREWGLIGTPVERADLTGLTAPVVRRVRRPLTQTAILPDKPCPGPGCGKPFQPSTKAQETCSRKCAGMLSADRRARLREQADFIAPVVPANLDDSTGGTS